MEIRDNFSKFETLRKKYPRFIFDSYRYEIKDNHLVINYKFIIPEGHVFQPSVRLKWSEEFFRPADELSEEILDNLIFHTGMIELVSYWKSTCSPIIALPEKEITNQQAGFWKKLYFNGLGEFFHMNSIHVGQDDLFQFEGQTTGVSSPLNLDLTGPALVPVGGGKDSAVTVSLVTKAGIPWLPLAMNPSNAIRDVLHAAGRELNDTALIYRSMDPHLLEMNAAGYLNGHTPFSALLAFYSLLTAYMTGSRDIVLSNESSANEATIPGTSINHQYSKTYEFEKDFRDYVRNYISPSFNYFSLLRPLTELQIASLFSCFPEYFRVFRSCNAGSKQGVWCGSCPKCLFTWIILSPFLEQDQLKDIFGKDLMEDPDLAIVLDELTGRSETKPFECIGTIDEVNAAMHYLAKQFNGQEMPSLLKHFVDGKPSPQVASQLVEEILTAWNDQHFVPSGYLELLRDGKNG